MEKPPAIDIARGAAILELLTDVQENISLLEEETGKFYETCMAKDLLWSWDEGYFLRDNECEAAIFCCLFYRVGLEIMPTDDSIRIDSGLA